VTPALAGMGASRSKSASNLTIPDIESLPASEREKAIKDLVTTINGQRIAFGFRKVEPDARGQEVLKSVAKGLRFVPEYSIRIEGHSNLAKSEDKLSAQDQARIQKLSEDRADACARLLKAVGVQNEITCVGQGPLKGESKGCVRLVLTQKWTPPEAKVNQSEVINEQLESKVAEGGLPQVDGDTSSIGVDSEKPETTVENATTVESVGVEEKTEDQVMEDRSTLEEGPKVTDPEDTDSRPGLIEPLVDPEDKGFKLVVQAEVPAPPSPPAPASTADNQAWGNTNLPWYITCCSAKPKVDECPMQGIAVKQIQLLQ